MSWRLPPRSSRWRWIRPELASRGATPLWRASWASLLKRSIGPISASSLAAVTAAQPGSSSSPGAICSDPLFEFLVELGDRAVERAAVRDELAREPHLQLLLATGEPAADALQVGGAAEHPQRHGVGRVELEEVPAQPLLGSPALVDEVVAMVDQQLDLAVDAARRAAAGSGPALAAPPARSRARRSGRTSRASCLPAAPGRSASAAPAPDLRRAEQLPLEPAGQLPAVLDRPQSAPRRARLPSRAARRFQPGPSSRSAAGRPRRPRPRSPTACERPVRSRSSRSPPMPLGATGERTDLTRGESHAPIRSRSTVSVGGGDTTLGSQPSGDIRNRVSRRRPSLSSRSDAATRPRLTVSSPNDA